MCSKPNRKLLKNLYKVYLIPLKKKKSNEKNIPDKTGKIIQSVLSILLK